MSHKSSKSLRFKILQICIILKKLKLVKLPDDPCSADRNCIAEPVTWYCNQQVW